MSYSLDDVRARATKPRDAWWTIFLVDPVALRLCVVAANRTAITPNQLTVTSLVVGLGASWAFWTGSTAMLALGAGLFYMSFLLDCMDGKIARLKGTGTPFGMWLDYIFDRVRVLAATVALMGGQHRLTGDDLYLWLAVGVVFADMLRYLNALRMQSLHEGLTARLTEARRAAGAPAEHVDQPGAFGDPALNRAFDERAPGFRRVRDWLASKRVRSHVFSGIEFQMFVFIVGPLSGQIAAVAIGSMALLLVFEAALVVKLWVAVRDGERMLGELRARAEGGT